MGFVFCSFWGFLEGERVEGVRDVEGEKRDVGWGLEGGRS